MKKIIFLVSTLFIVGVASAQSNFITHTIKDGETLSQLAKQYGTTVGDIMRLNKMTTDSKLSIGEEVKIPATGAPVETTHTVVKGETLYQIAHKNHITVAQLRDWNNIPDNSIKVGQLLRLTEPSQNSVSETAGTSSQSSASQVDSATQTTTSAANSDYSVSVDSAVLAASDAKQRTDVGTDQASSGVAMGNGEGAFTVTYQSHANGTEMITKGTSGIFKTASGWQDKKYYILMNDIAPGTIVKVQANSKTVYAKVLWNLGNVKDNEGLSYRISDAAASVLNLNGNTFDIIVSYYKSN
ncbi:MAG TPA: LysM peptidoglycan-binding domain-containing protein [Arachidicoccus sp.]